MWPWVHVRHACEARASGVQVAAGDVKALGLAAALDDGVALAEGGLLYHDSVHGVWLYEGDAVHARLLALKQARPPVTASQPRLVVYI